MSDRIESLTVALDVAMREEDAAPIMQAIRQLRGVVAVESQVSDISAFVARAQMDIKWRDALLALMERRIT